MRVANLLVLGSALMLVWACASTNLTPTRASGQPVSVEGNRNDCAVISAVAKEHYKFSPENPPPPLKGAGDAHWRPQCDFEAQGFVFTEYDDIAPPQDPRERLKWVSFQQPFYDGRSATVVTEIMHGPLAGISYECRVLSGFAGWTVGECKTNWVS